MIINLNLDKNQKYILGCSFGPDSMALLSMLIDKGYNVVVAHANFHLRKEAIQEELGLNDYCKKHNVEMYVAELYKPENINEEAWARITRYDFFNELGTKLNIKNVLIAHNQDDLIETYLLQKKRKNIVQYYGINKKTNYKNVQVLRPLLSVSKQDLLNHCIENGVPFSVDASNFNKEFARNKIRIDVVKDMNAFKREELENEIQKANDNLKYLNNKLKIYYKNGYIKKDDILKMNNDEFYHCLINYFKSRSIYMPISKKFSDEIKLIIENKTTWHYKITDFLYLSFDYEILRIYKIKIKIDDPKTWESFFKINYSSNLSSILQGNDCKIILGLKTNEKFKFGNMIKKVGRCFIDWKIPYVYRLVWPGIYNQDGVLLYVPHYQKDYAFNENSLLVFDLKNIID